MRERRFNFALKTLHFERVECLLKEVAPTCPRPRFARRGQASRNSPAARSVGFASVFRLSIDFVIFKSSWRAQRGASVEMRVGGPKAAKRPRSERATSGPTLCSGDHRLDPAERVRFRLRCWP